MKTLDAVVPFPIPYQGSKRKLAPAILRCLPDDTAKLYEPFCGSAAVTISALANGHASEAHLNDMNGPLIELLELIAHDPDHLCEMYEAIWNEQLGNEREFYDQVRQEFNQNKRPELFLYLLARCVKSAVRYNTAGEFNQSPDNRRRGTKPPRMSKHIREASRIIAGKVTFSSVDYLESIQPAKPDDVVYMDPPYQGVSTVRDRRYLESINFDDFVDGLGILNDRSVSYIISYDGRTGSKRHGKSLPEHLKLGHFEIDAGRSTQATFLGKDDRTIESLYLSPALLDRLGGAPSHLEMTADEGAPTLFEV